MFSWEFCEISHNIFFKEPFKRLLLHKYSLCLLSHRDLLPFQNRCDTNFPAEYFLGLICRLGKKVSLIFQKVGEKPEVYFKLSRTSLKQLFSWIWLTAESHQLFSQKSSMADIRPGSKYASVSSH